MPCWLNSEPRNRGWDCLGAGRVDRCKAFGKRKFKLPWREAASHNHRYASAFGPVRCQSRSACCLEAEGVAMGVLGRLRLVPRHLPPTLRSKPTLFWNSSCQAPNPNPCTLNPTPAPPPFLKSTPNPCFADLLRQHPSGALRGGARLPRHRRFPRNPNPLT